jgi:hypothetical protein
MTVSIMTTARSRPPREHADHRRLESTDTPLVRTRARRVKLAGCAIYAVSEAAGEPHSHIDRAAVALEVPLCEESPAHSQKRQTAVPSTAVSIWLLARAPWWGGFWGPVTAAEVSLEPIDEPASSSIAPGECRSTIGEEHRNETAHHDVVGLGYEVVDLPRPYRHSRSPRPWHLPFPGARTVVETFREPFLALLRMRATSSGTEVSYVHPL